MTPVTLAGGRVVDPATRTVSRRDLVFRSGVVHDDMSNAQVPDGRATMRQHVDATGAFVTPGLIDLHGHFFVGGFPFGLAPDAHARRCGAVAVVDAGSAGWANYPSFRTAALLASRIPTFAFVNVAAIGLVPRSVGVGELSDARYVDEGNLVAFLEGAGPEVLGIKVRLTLDAGAPDVLAHALNTARRVADACGTRLMVHVCGSPLPMADVVPLLGAGDVLAHYLHDGNNGILDSRRRVRPEIVEARERGVLMEVGHGGFHVGHDVARAAIDAGVWPDVISTDAHVSPPGRDVPSLPELMSMFLTLGVPLVDVVAAVTAGPAEVIGDPSFAGTFRPGVGRNATVLEEVDVARVLTDRTGDRLHISTTLRVRDVIIDGGLRADVPEAESAPSWSRTFDAK